MSRLSRGKTDKADYKLIAHFCKAMKPDLWQPTPKHIQELQQGVRRLDSLIANKNQENNRLEGLSFINSKIIVNTQDGILAYKKADKHRGYIEVD